MGTCVPSNKKNGPFDGPFSVLISRLTRSIAPLDWVFQIAGSNHRRRPSLLFGNGFVVLSVASANAMSHLVPRLPNLRAHTLDLCRRRITAHSLPTCHNFSPLFVPRDECPQRKASPKIISQSSSRGQPEKEFFYFAAKLLHDGGVVIRGIHHLNKDTIDNKKTVLSGRFYRGLQFRTQCLQVSA